MFSDFSCFVVVALLYTNVFSLPFQQSIATNNSIICLPISHFATYMAAIY